MGRWLGRFFQAAEASQPGCITHHFSQTPVIGMLIFNRTWGQHRAWTNTADNSRYLNGVSETEFQMGITVKFDEFNRCTQQASGFFRFSYSFSGCAMRSGFAARTNDKMHFASRMRFARDDAAAAKFNVVGMGAEGQQWRKFR